MATDIDAINGSGLDAALGNIQPKRNTGGEVGKNEFLQLLVTQLKNQDPLEPMKNEQFAVNLAQFSQLEQLVSINEKIGAESSDANSFSSLAGYLGNQVKLNSNTLEVAGGDGGTLEVNLTGPADKVTVELLDSEGQVVEKKNFTNLQGGVQNLDMSGLESDIGSFSYKASVAYADGTSGTVNAAVVGIVTGFIPGADPKLMIGDRQISLSEIGQVTLAPEKESTL
jgi:flagellar basal-body rod modification protein FlgD